MENVNKIIERVNNQKKTVYKRGEIYYIEKSYVTGCEQEGGQTWGYCIK